MEQNNQNNARIVGLYTLGCKVAQYETEAIGEAFARRGFRVGDFDGACDVYVVNTCTVTAESDRKSRQVIRRAARRNPGAVLMVTGCYSQRSPDEVARIPGVSVVIGTADKLSLVDLAQKLLAEKEERPAKAPIAADVGGKDAAAPRALPLVRTTDVRRAAFEPMCITSVPRTRAYVKIEDGCECRCTYCAISDARGGVRSKPAADVIAEIEALYRAGTREIVLTGIETGSYGRDFAEPFGLADLLSELNRRASCERVRLSSLSPELADARFAEEVARLPILAPHFHLSVQSGSDAVLAAMRRRYTAAGAMENIERLRRLIPSAMFTTDLMVGFPGETEEDFLRTVDFVRRARFLLCHVFVYSRRKGTVADRMPDQIPEDEKRRRSERLMRVAREVRERLLDETVAAARPLSCVFETDRGGVWSGHSDSYIEVSVPSSENLHGEIRNVLPIRREGDVLVGKIV